MTGVLAFVRSRYDRRSAVALGLLGAVYLAVAIIWNRYIDLSQGMDWLLVGIWVFMTALLCWDVDPRRDLPLVGVGFLGGLVIEWWGTTTHIWWYFTKERPPMWIIPAWPVAAMAIDRLARLAGQALPEWSSPLPFWLMAVPFVVAMCRFAVPGAHILSTQVIIALMLGVIATVREPRREAITFLVGALLGIFLEYWGTSRYCWRYYTREVPPVEAVVAHGFASVAFLRGVQALELVRNRLRP